MYKYYELLTDVVVPQIEAWKKEAEAGRVNPRDLKASLARMIITDFWGTEKAQAAAEEFDRVHRDRETPTNTSVVHIKVTVETHHLRPLINIMMDMNLFPSRGEAKRVMQQGGVYLDGVRIVDIQYQVDIAEKKEHLLKIGKIRFYKFIVD